MGTAFGLLIKNGNGNGINTVEMETGAGVKRELLDTVKARKLAYYGDTMRKQGSCLEKEIMQGTMQLHAGEEDHARPGLTTSRRGQDSL